MSGPNRTSQINPLAIDTRPQANPGASEKFQSHAAFVDNTPNFLPRYDDGSTDQLVNALGAWHPAIQQYQKTLETKDAKEGDFLAVTEQELPENASHATSQAFLGARGRLASREDTAELQKKWEEHPDKDTSDYTAFSRDFFKERLGGVAAGPYRNAYVADLPAVIEKGAAAHQEYLKGRLQAKIGGTALQLLDGDLSAGIVPDSSWLASRKAEMGAMGITEDKANELIFDSANRAALNGNLSALDALKADTSPSSPYQDPALRAKIDHARDTAETHILIKQEREEVRKTRVRDREQGEVLLNALAALDTDDPEAPKKYEQTLRDMREANLLTNAADYDKWFNMGKRHEVKQESSEQMTRENDLLAKLYTKGLTIQEVRDDDGLKVTQKYRLFSQIKSLESQNRAEARADAATDNRPAIYKSFGFTQAYSQIDDLAGPTEAVVPLTTGQQAQVKLIQSQARAEFVQGAASIDPKDREGLHKLQEYVATRARNRVNETVAGAQSGALAPRFHNKLEIAEALSARTITMAEAMQAEAFLDARKQKAGGR